MLLSGFPISFEHSMCNPPGGISMAPRTANSKGAWHNPLTMAVLVVLVGFLHHWSLHMGTWMASPKALVTLGSAPCLVTKDCGSVSDLIRQCHMMCTAKTFASGAAKQHLQWSWISQGRLWHQQGRSAKTPLRLANLQNYSGPKKSKKRVIIAIIIRNDPVWDDSNMTHLLASSCRDHPSTQQPGSPLRTPSCNGVCPWPSSASQHEAYEMEQLSNFQTLTCAVGSALSKSLGNTKGPILYSQSHASLVRVHAMWVFCSLYSPLRIPVPHDQCLRIISTLSNICPRF